MDRFLPRLLQIDAGARVALTPVAFSGRVDELTLERWIVENPALVGEELLVLGHQLAEFEEDKDRLGILALDRFGEIVLIELKVTEDFRVTDLQALAYAGAYAKRTSKDLAGTPRTPHAQARYRAHSRHPSRVRRRRGSRGLPGHRPARRRRERRCCCRPASAVTAEMRGR